MKDLKITQKVKISLDSRNYETIKKCLNLRLSMINDISGLSDHRLIKLINKNKICVVIMHMQNNPENMQINPKYKNVIFTTSSIKTFQERIVK